MKKRLIVLLMCALTVLSFSCSQSGWKGFYEEDLSKYLTLADYTKLTYEKTKTEVSDAEVDERIALLLTALAEVKEVDKKLESGMSVSFDRFCFIDGTAKPELSEEGGLYTIDDDEYEDKAVALLLPKLVGMKKGDTATFEIVLPAGYGGLKKDKTASYTVTVLSVYEQTVPKLTDSVAPQLIAGYNTVSALKAEVRRRLERDKENEAATKMAAALRKELIDKSVLLSSPYSLYQDCYEDRMYLYEKLADAASMTLAEYLEECTDMTMSELQTLVSEAATTDVKEALVLYSVVKKEGISYSKVDISDYAEKMATESEGVFESGEEYLSYYGNNAVTTEYLWSRVMEIVISAVESS